MFHDAKGGSKSKVVLVVSRTKRGAAGKYPFDSSPRGVDGGREVHCAACDGSDSVNNTQKTGLLAGVKGCTHLVLSGERLITIGN